jgi:hypothetical protein
MRQPWKGSPFFWATCPRCGSRQRWQDAKTCSECNTRLYPTRDEIERCRREHS